MKPISDKSLDVFEETALEGAKKLRAFFAYEGENPSYFQKARLGAVAISGFARIRASETNRLAVEHAARRTSGSGK